MSRDERVRLVLEALATMLAYDDARRARGEEVFEGEVDCLLTHVLFGARDHTFDGWPAESVRALLVAACTHAPTTVLDQWAKAASDVLDGHTEMLKEIA